MNGTSKNIIAELIENRKLIKSLAKNDFKIKFAGSYLGTLWAFVQPVITVLIYWFVFDKAIGARVNMQTALPLPYVLWLVAGIVPWFFFSDCVSAGTAVLAEYNYLVKKVVFNIDILPVVKVFASIFVHAFFVAFMLALFVAYGYLPDLYVLQPRCFNSCTGNQLSYQRHLCVFSRYAPDCEYCPASRNLGDAHYVEHS